ncbi:MAG: hypothetical protein JRJ66_10765 [Deltaproteobacteria bacterium]|nr:hypothetical protein [Deltaproteobacteria bacterium]
MSGYELYNNFKIYFETPDDGFSYFFGYYDKSPLNKSNTKLLAHRVSFDGREVRDGDVAEVGYFDLATKNFHKVDETLAWNWQQGSQLQWMPPDFESEIIYNSIKKGRFVSIRFNIFTEKKRIIPFPIYVIHPNGKEALGVNYERLYWCRPGYNYQNVKNSKWNVPIHPEDGIFKVNLETGDVKLIIRTQDVVNMSPNEEILSSNNWLEHMMYNPSGDRFMFFHRWHKDNIDHTRLFTANSMDGGEPFMFPDTRFYSHAAWKNDKELTIWAIEPPKRNEISMVESLALIARKNNCIKKCLKPFYLLIKPLLPRKTAERISPQSKLLTYYDQTCNYYIIANGVLSGNGHITWSKRNVNVILYDTYQDEKKYRSLRLFDIKNKHNRKIGQFFSQYNECGYRADLHPRFDYSEDFIIIDSAHLKKRKVLIIKEAIK